VKTIPRNLLLQQYKDIKRFEKYMSPLSKRVLCMKIARIYRVNTNPWTFRFRAVAICEKRSIERMQRLYCNTQSTWRGGWGGTIACPARIIGFNILDFYLWSQLKSAVYKTVVNKRGNVHIT